MDSGSAYPNKQHITHVVECMQAYTIPLLQSDVLEALDETPYDVKCSSA